VVHWLRLAALAAAVVLLFTLPRRPLFLEVYGRLEALEAASLVESALGPAQRVVFFEVNPVSVCAAWLEGSSSLEGIWGKEWVVRGYRGAGLVYELRVDAGMGFSMLRVNLTLVERPQALIAALMLLRREGGGVFQVEDERGSLSVSAWRPEEGVCRGIVREAEQWRGATIITWVVMQVVFLTGLLLAVALPTGGVSKRRLLLIALPLLLALGASSTLLQLPYLLGKNALPPTLRSLFNLLYSSALLSLTALISLIAGAALVAKSAPLSLPTGRRAAESWLDGVATGATLTALLGVAFTLLEKWGRVIPLKLPALENALTVQASWLAAALNVAVASLINAVTFRYLLLLLLQEVLGGRGQGVVATSAIYALAFAGASFHPPYTDVLAALALSLVFCLLYLWRGLFAAVAAEYTYNALAYALSISGLLPVDALLLAVTPLSAAPLASLLAELARRFAS